jgi:hypothetical protein
VAEIEVKIEGLEAMLAKLKPALYAEPLRRFWNRSAIAVQSHARDRAPSDMGKLRASILYEIDDATPPQYAKVGVLSGDGPGGMMYAIYQEYGTSPHFVPAEYIGAWAQRHGFGYTGLMVSGEAHPYLEPGFRDAEGQIQSYVGVLGTEIEANWGS